MTAPIIAMIYNTAMNRWHPMFFLSYPPPSADASDVSQRYKSKMHHTAGFDTREEAVACANGKLADTVRQAFGWQGDPLFCLDKDFSWDGEGIPAMVVFFIERDGRVQPAF